MSFKLENFCCDWIMIVTGDDARAGESDPGAVSQCRRFSSAGQATWSAGPWTRPRAACSLLVDGEPNTHDLGGQRLKAPRGLAGVARHGLYLLGVVTSREGLSNQGGRTPAHRRRCSPLPPPARLATSHA